MRVNREEVVRIARLAMLEFQASELDQFTAQFEEILDFIEQLQEAPTQGVSPSYSGLPEEEMTTPLREDETTPSLSQEEALRNAPDAAEGHFRVPQVIGSEP